MSSKPSQLQDHLGYWLRKLSNQVSASFAERLTRFDISVPQWVILRILFDHESLPLKDIVSRVEGDQGSLSRMIDRMLAKGLVSRFEGEDDRRKIAISLTPEGRKLVPKLAREADKNDRAFFAEALSERQSREFLVTIKTLLAHHQSDPKSPSA